tara:strand:+ start:578 stop:955 length:378 start_codon:yes stop_codon:yes gene_type:complete
MCIFRDRLRNDLSKVSHLLCHHRSTPRTRKTKRGTRDDVAHKPLSLSRLPLFCGVVRRKGSLTQREDYLRGVGLLQTKREKTHAIRFYIRKSKRYGLGYQDVEEEEEEEEEELERRRRIERRTQL